MSESIKCRKGHLVSGFNRSFAWMFTDEEDFAREVRCNLFYCKECDRAYSDLDCIKSEVNYGGITDNDFAKALKKTITEGSFLKKRYKDALQLSLIERMAKEPEKYAYLRHGLSLEEIKELDAHERQKHSQSNDGWLDFDKQKPTYGQEIIIWDEKYQVARGLAMFCNHIPCEQFKKWKPADKLTVEEHCSCGKNQMKNGLDPRASTCLRCGKPIKKIKAMPKSECENEIWPHEHCICTSDKIMPWCAFHGSQSKVYAELANHKCTCIDRVIEALELAENLAAIENLDTQQTFAITINKLKELKDK